MTERAVNDSNQFFPNQTQLERATARQVTIALSKTPKPGRNSDSVMTNEDARLTPTVDVINVLIVEDDIDDFYLVRQILSRDRIRKYDIAHCDSLQQSIDFLERTKVDVVLLDLGLGETSGLKTLQLMIKEIQLATPIVVLTGSSDEEVGDRAIKAGADDYLPKAEVTTSLLSRAIRYAIERHFLLRQFQQRATTDALTLLPNRSALMERIENLIHDASRNDSKFAVAMLDLDGFKGINDDLGHLAGDEVLKAIAKRMQLKLRCSDMAARLGGDEFVILLTNYHSEKELLEVVKKKQAVIGRPIEFEHEGACRTETVGISVGVAQWQEGMTSMQLIAMADAAMYESKHGGKNIITLACEKTNSQ